VIFRQLFDRESCTYTYLLGVPGTDGAQGEAILIDPVVELVDRDLQLLDELGLKLVASIDTHVHADHITGAWTLKQRTGCAIVYPGPTDAEDADRVLADGDVFQAGENGEIRLETRLTPGHTACSATYVQLDRDGAPLRAFTGDTLMIRGCGRTDFQGGSAEDLYASVRERIFTLPGDTPLYPGHDYKGRTVTTVAEERAHNPRLKDGIDVATFRQIMENLGLAYPKKIDVAVPANQNLGRPPA
jgi:glyoxylase-like metal-dependent hydrolase (beta-lactamase superfamily II)